MLLLLGAAHKSILSAEPNPVLSNAEIEFTDLVMAADAELDLNRRASAEQFLLQAGQILSQEPGIQIFLKAHFNKVSGKMYMTYNATTALQYFNLSVSQFSGNTLEQAEAKMFIGITYYHAGNYTAAKSYFDEAKAAFDAQGDLPKSAQVLNNLGVLNFRQGNLEMALLFCNRSLSINTEIGNRVNAARNQQNLAVITGSGSSSGGGSGSAGNPLGDIVEAFGGTGTGTTITTSGSGTVVVPTPGG
jgi:tetratricopeptide (TPR) repeat protein